MTERSFEALLEAAQSGSPQSQYELGRYYVEEQEFGRARRWFGRAGRAGVAKAWAQLGLLELQGLGLAADHASAREHFKAAAEGGDPEGRYQLALLEYRRSGEIEPALDGLVEAARAGHAGAQRQIGILYLRNDPELGIRILRLAAGRGDMIAQSALAGVLDRAERSEEAERWAALARHAGSYCRERFEPVGAQSTPGAAQRERSLTAREIPRPDIPTEEPVEARYPAGDERVAVFENMFSPVECEYLMEMAAPYLRPSHTVHPTTGEAVRNEMRTSYGFSFHPTQEDFLVLILKQRLTKQTPLSLRNAEPFAMLRYAPGQEYKSHFDYIDPSSGEAGREISRFGQRRYTIFSYLTDVAEGGETEFPKREVKIRPKQGRALLFSNTLPDGSPDTESLHASLPVVKGEKWIATLWLRDKEIAR